MGYYEFMDRADNPQTLDKLDIIIWVIWLLVLFGAIIHLVITLKFSKHKSRYLLNKNKTGARRSKNE